MATERQIAANHKNALFSTDPRTVEGKSIVRGNAIKHGILTNKVFVQEGAQEEFDRMREGFYLEFQPQGRLKTFLLERVISCAWRLALITHIESEMYCAESLWEKMSSSFEDSSGSMMTLSRYENAIEKSLYRALATFKQVQFHKAESVVEIGFVS